MTPRVREEVRRHYGCDTLSGAELEDQGEEGTALTHWEKRLFEVSTVRESKCCACVCVLLGLPGIRY